MSTAYNLDDVCSDDCQMALATAHSEREYDRTMQHTMHLIEIDRGRVKAVKQMLLQFENETLQVQLDQANLELVKIRETEAQLRMQLNQTQKEVDHLNDTLHVSLYDTENLRNELASLSNTASETTKLMDENIRLSRDLASLRSETERMRRHDTSLQNIVAEKQALTRQLNMVEEQFENEKRAHERTRSRETRQAEEIVVLSSKLEESCKDLAEQTQAQEVQNRTARHQVLESEAQRAALEEKLVNLNRKLRLMKDQYQETQGDSHPRRVTLKTTGASESFAKPRTIPHQRSASQIVPEMAIATPGAIQPRKKGKQPSALPGDKSSFSITPFLKRAGGLRNSPSSSDNDLSEMHTVAMSEHTPEKSPTDRMVPAKDVTASRQRDNAMSSSSDEPRITNVKQPGQKHLKTKATKSISTRAQSPYSGDEILNQNVGLAFNRASDSHQNRPKKRKLAYQRDKHLLAIDEDMDILEVKKPGRKLALSSGPNPSDGSQLNVHSSVLQGRGFGSLAEFSPLKKDRKRI